MPQNKYETHVEPKLILVEGWARDGLTDEQIAKNLGVGYSTFRSYFPKYPALLAALKTGKEVADYMVENALFKKATEGDNVAMIFWLKNRRPDRWRDKPESDQELKMLIKLLSSGAGFTPEQIEQIVKAGKNDG